MRALFVELATPEILLRFAGLDALHADSQAQPPDAQPAETSGTGRGERWTVVRPDRVGKAELREGGIEDTLCLDAIGIRQRLRAEGGRGYRRR
jgi:hypothetical protein